ncbi:MAG: 50S ribosomal protein L29 [Candidatus Brennerbacteria bacterium]|nr:50S ribosomal protein L29 [Candidatus Brennerbacteria bacterium]
MKRKELENLKSKTPVELDKELRDYRERLLNLKMDLALGKVKNIREIKELKRSIAQLLTVKKTREKTKV